MRIFKIFRGAKDTDSDYREIILRLNKIELVYKQAKFWHNQIGALTNNYTLILGYICDRVCDPVIYALHSTKA